MPAGRVRRGVHFCSASTVSAAAPVPMGGGPPPQSLTVRTTDPRSWMRQPRAGERQKGCSPGREHQS
jgi:hypothetical protein